MKFKGRTNIELRNAITGVVEKSVYSENMFTDALSNILNLPRSLSGNYELQKGVYDREWNANLPISKNALGGVLLFDGVIPEVASSITPPDGVSCTGYANQEGITYSNLMRGLPVVGETLELPNGYKYTWTFNAQTANGNIGCVCLTSNDGGSCGWNSADLRNSLFINTAFKYNANMNFKDSSFLIAAGGEVADEGEDRVIYWKIDERADFDLYATAGNGNNAYGTVISFYKCKKGLRASAGINSVLSSALAVLDLELIVTIDFSAYVAKANGEGNTLLDVNGFDYDELTDSYYYTLAKYETKTTSSITVIKLTGDELTMSVQTVLDSSILVHIDYIHGANQGRVLNGYLYYPSKDKNVYKINLANTVDTVKLVTGSEAIGVVSIIGGKVMFYPKATDYASATTARTKKSYVYDGTVFNEVAYWTSDRCVFVRRKMLSESSPYLCWYYEKIGGKNNGLYLARISPYLATINNLETPVTKTSSQVMTITYVVEEVDVPS